jgi:hypothetical protein
LGPRLRARASSAPVDQLMGHHGGRRRDGDGSAIGLRYRHMTAEMQARVVAVIDRYLAVAQRVLRSPR